MSTSNGDIVTARDLSRRFGEGQAAVDALKDVTVAFRRGQFSAIMGPSGSGKSTLMHCLAGLDLPTEGSVTVAGVALESLDDTALTVFRREHIGFVFQSFNLLPMLTAEQNIVLPVGLAGRRPSPGRFDHVVDTLGLRDRLTHRPPSSPAGGSSAWRSPAP